MKPIKALYPLSIWLMRIGLVLFAFTEYYKTFSKFKIEDGKFYLSLIFIAAAVIIFISGFVYKATITVLSGLAISIISIYNIIIELDGGIDSGLVVNIIIASLALFFLSKSTNKY